MEVTAGKMRVRVVPFGSVYTCASTRDDETVAVQQDARIALSDKDRWQHIVHVIDQRDETSVPETIS